MNVVNWGGEGRPKKISSTDAICSFDVMNQVPGAYSKASSGFACTYYPNAFFFFSSSVFFFSNNSAI